MNHVTAIIANEYLIDGQTICVNCGVFINTPRNTVPRDFLTEHSGHRIQMALRTEDEDMSNSTRSQKLEMVWRNEVRDKLTDLLLVMDPDDPIGPGNLNYAGCLDYGIKRLQAEFVAAGQEDGEKGAEELCAYCNEAITPETRVYSAQFGVFCNVGHFMLNREKAMAEHQQTTPAPVVASDDLPGLPMD